MLAVLPLSDFWTETSLTCQTFKHFIFIFYESVQFPSSVQSDVTDTTGSEGEKVAEVAQ